MKYLLTLILSISAPVFSQDQMTMEEYNEKLKAARQREEVALPKVASLKTKIAALKEELASTSTDAKRVWRDILKLVGVTQMEYDDFITGVETLQNEISGFESTYGEDFTAWSGALKDAQGKINEFKSSRIAAIPRVERMLNEIDQALIDSRQALTSAKEAAASASAETDYSGSADSYTVSTGNSLWRIAKNSEVFGDPLRWPELYDANRDIIQNPDLIFPGQVINIPR